MDLEVTFSPPFQRRSTTKWGGGLETLKSDKTTKAIRLGQPFLFYDINLAN